MNISRLQPPHPKKKKKTKRINRFQIYILSSPNAKYWSMQWISQLYSGYMQHDWIHSHTALIGIRNDCLFKAAWPLTGPQNMDRFDWISSTASLNRNDCLFEAAGPLTVTIWRSLFFWHHHGHSLRFLAGLSFASSPARLGRFSKTYPHALHDTLTQTALLPVRVTMWCGQWSSSSSSSPPLCAFELAAALGLESELELELESSIGLALYKRSARGFIIPGITSNILTTNRRQRLSGSTHRNGEFSMVGLLMSFVLIPTQIVIESIVMFQYQYLSFLVSVSVSILSCHYCHCWWLDTGLLIQAFKDHK